MFMQASNGNLRQAVSLFFFNNLFIEQIQKKQSSYYLELISDQSVKQNDFSFNDQARF